MLKEVILVPKDKCPLDVLAEMGPQTANSWIYLHKNAVEKLRNTSHFDFGFASFIELKWKETSEYPATLIWIDNSTGEWLKVLRVQACDIAFRFEASDPEQIFFLQMEE